MEKRLSDWTPGGLPHALPLDTALPLKKGTDLVLMLRCQTDGQPEQEQTTIGLYFAPRPPRLTPFMRALGACEMLLKANQTATVTETYTLPAAVRVLRVVPHADPIGVHITLIATLPTEPRAPCCKSRIGTPIGRNPTLGQPPCGFLQEPVCP